MKTQYPIFRLWEAPSFEPIISWTIFELQHPMVRRVIDSKLTSFTSRDAFEDMRQDVSNKAARVEDYYLKPHEFEALKLYQPISIQIMHDLKFLVEDGTTYGMQLLAYAPVSVFIAEWQEGLPDEWREMTDWAKRIRLSLSELIDKPHPPMKDVIVKDINQRYPPDYKIWRRLGEE